MKEKYKNGHVSFVSELISYIMEEKVVQGRSLSFLPDLQSTSLQYVI